MTAARLARLALPAMSSRSTAAVESRSSQSAIGRGGGQVGAAGEVAGEGAGRLRARAFGAVHVDRKAEHEADRPAFGGKGEEPRSVGRKGGAGDSLDAGREPAIGIRGGGPDGL